MHDQLPRFVLGPQTRSYFTPIDALTRRAGWPGRSRGQSYVATCAEQLPVARNGLLAGLAGEQVLFGRTNRCRSEESRFGARARQWLN